MSPDPGCQLPHPAWRLHPFQPLFCPSTPHEGGFADLSVINVQILHSSRATLAVDSFPTTINTA